MGWSLQLLHSHPTAGDRAIDRVKRLLGSVNAYGNSLTSDLGGSGYCYVVDHQPRKFSVKPSGATPNRPEFLKLPHDLVATKRFYLRSIT